jgi:hypothetical protein
MTDLPVHDPDLGVHHADPGVHHGPIRVFTFGRSERSRWTDARTLRACTSLGTQPAASISSTIQYQLPIVSTATGDRRAA